MEENMKRISCIILLVLLFTVLFAGCSKNDELSIRICGYSDSIPENSHKLEYKDWSKGTFTDFKAKKDIDFSIGAIHVAGNYIETEKRFSEFYNTHTYKDKENRYFSLTDDGKLCAYFFGNCSIQNGSERIYTESECIDIASTFLSDIIDVSHYTVTTTFNESRRMYTISFVKYADGYRCSDRADIMIEETGYIYSFSSTMLGRISPEAVTNFDYEKMYDQIVSKLDREYSNAKQVYDDVSYENFDYELTINSEGEYALICSIDVKCSRSHNGYNSVISERILLLIQ